MTAFMFATGIECSYPMIRDRTHRVDALRTTGHYERWREDLALKMQAELAVEVVVVNDLATAARRSDVVVTCTPSRAPLLGAGDVSPGTFIAAVGADNPEKQELASALVARAVVVADITEQCARVGELHHAIAAGLMTAQDVYGELGEVVAGRKPGRTSATDVVVFDSTGTALQDVAAAALAYERAGAAGPSVAAPTVDLAR